MYGTGYWSIVDDLAAQGQLLVFERCHGLLPQLASARQYKLLACAASQV